MPSGDDIPLVDRQRLQWSTGNDSLLGEGSFGRVYLGTFDGSPVAIKVLRRPTQDGSKTPEEQRTAENSAMKQHRREVKRLGVVQNPNIIQYFGVYRDVRPTDLYIVTEYLEGGSLHDSLAKMRDRQAVLDDRSFLQCARHMAFGLNHVHSQRYTHGDLKPQNVLLTSAFQFRKRPSGDFVASLALSAKAKIADFGLSKRLEGAEQANGLLGSSVGTGDFGSGPCGTYLYMSPEAYSGVASLSDADAKAADIYAYGLILYELLTGLQSWGIERVQNAMQLYSLVRGGHRPAWGDRKSSINPEYINLVERCWNHEPRSRPTIQDVVTTLAGLSRRQVGEAADQYALGISTPISTPPGLDNEPLAIPPSSTVLEPSQESRQNTQKATYLQHSESSEEGSEGSISGSIRCPTITHVESMKPLTQSEERRLAGSAHQDSMDFTLAVSTPFQEVRPSVDLRLPNETSTASESVDSNVESNDLVAEPEPNRKSSVPEIDQSVLGGQPVVRVQTIAIEAPKTPALDIGFKDPGNPSHGSESITDAIQPRAQDDRKQDDVLNSFFRAAKYGHLGDSEQAKEEDGRQNHAPSPPSRGEDSKLGLHPYRSEQNRNSANFHGPAGAPSDPVRDDSSKYVSKAVGRTSCYGIDRKAGEIHLKLPCGTNSRSYNSPEQFDEDSLDELIENDTISLSSYNPLFTTPGERCNSASHGYHSPGQGPSVPFVRPSIPQPEKRSPRSYVAPLPEANGEHCHSGHSIYSRVSLDVQNPYESPRRGPDSATHGAPGPSQPGSAGQFIKAQLGPNCISTGRANPLGTTNGRPRDFERRKYPDAVDSQDIVSALQSSDAWTHLVDIWRRGHTRRVASGLASYRGLGGTEMLLITCKLLDDHNKPASGKRDPEVAKDLCAAIGNVARNEAVPIDRQAVFEALCVTLSTMFAYRQSFHENVQTSVEVFAACNFAFCNLFKVYNVIEDPAIRTKLAEWIAYSISWNVFQDGDTGVHGPHFETLAYTASSAARNFMWMNEDNVIAFTTINPSGAASTVSRLISSMMCFDREQCTSVVEASLSALATVIHFPKQQLEFLRQHGVRTLVDILYRHPNEAKIASLVFSMIAMLLSGANINQKGEDMRQVFAVDHLCQGLVRYLDQARRSVPNVPELVDVLEKGYLALLSTARLAESLRANVAGEATPGVLAVAQWLAVYVWNFKPGSNENALRGSASLAKVLVDLIHELCNESSSVLAFREQGLQTSLETLLNAFNNDAEFARRCREAIIKLAAD